MGNDGHPRIPQPIHRPRAQFADRVDVVAARCRTHRPLYHHLATALPRRRDQHRRSHRTATSRFADDVAEAVGPTVWNSGCNSWYFADDNTIDLWPFDRKRLTRMLAEPRDDDYIFTA